jgi:hypothetical protein
MYQSEYANFIIGPWEPKRFVMALRRKVEAVQFESVGLGWLNWYSLCSRPPADSCERDDNDPLFPKSPLVSITTII